MTNLFEAAKDVMISEAVKDSGMFQMFMPRRGPGAMDLIVQISVQNSKLNKIYLWTAKGNKIIDQQPTVIEGDSIEVPLGELFKSKMGK